MRSHNGGGWMGRGYSGLQKGGGHSGIFDNLYSTRSSFAPQTYGNEQNKVGLNVAAIEGRSVLPIFTTRKRSCRILVFSQVSVSTRRGGVVLPPQLYPKSGPYPQDHTLLQGCNPPPPQSGILSC